MARCGAGRGARRGEKALARAAPLAAALALVLALALRPASASRGTAGPGPWGGAAPPEWASHALARASLAAHPLARCNDGQPAALFTDAPRDAPAPAERSSFVVYVEGGSACWDADSCGFRLERFGRPGYAPGGGFNPLMRGLPDEARASDELKAHAAAPGIWPEALNVGGPLLGQPGGAAADGAPFAGSGWHRAYIPYCTSDMHMGRRCGQATGAATDAVLGVDTANATSGYCGAHVMEAALQELVAHYGMGSAAQVVLWGISAGGVGAAHHAEAWREALGPAVDMRLVLDSAWLPPTPPVEEASLSGQDYRGGGLVDELDVSTRNALEWGTKAPRACEDEARQSLGIGEDGDHTGAAAAAVTATLAAWCAPVRRILPHTQAPAWVLQAVYDLYVFIPALGLLPARDIADTTLFDSAILYRWMEEYGALSRASLEAAAFDVRTAQHTAVMPACLMHGASYHDERWLLRSIPYFESTGQPDWSYDNYAFASVDFPWMATDPLDALEGLRVHNQSVLELLGAWVRTDPSELLARGVYTPGVIALPGMRLLADTCSGINCNPSCEAAFHLMPAGQPKIGLGAPNTIGEILTVMLLALLLAFLIVSDLVGIALSFVRTKRWADLEASYALRRGMAKAIRPSAVADTGGESGGAAAPTSDEALSLEITAPKETPFPIELCCVTYSVTNWDTGKQMPLLRDVSLRFVGARLTAVMGSSGCGKTTLIEMMMGRRLSGRVEGLLLRNGVQASDGTDAGLTNVCGYVPQFEFDAYPTLTPREALLYEVGVRLPHLSSAAAVRRVRHVLKVVALGDKADTKIGTTGGGGGLSGGQRRRLSVGKQLLRDPLWVFGDEPTSGLDSHGTLELIHSLRNITAGGRAIALSIHQPRQEVFTLFDDLVLLSKGRVVFAGTVTEAIEYFTGPQGVVRAYMPVIANPADAMLDLISMDDSTVDTVVEKFVPRQRLTALLVLGGVLKALASNKPLLALAERNVAEGDDEDDMVEEALARGMPNARLIRLADESVEYARTGFTRKAAATSPRSLTTQGSIPHIGAIASDAFETLVSFKACLTRVFGVKPVQVVVRVDGSTPESNDAGESTGPSGLAKWLKVVATLHGRQFRTDIEMPRENLASLAFVIFAGALFCGITFYMPGRDAQGYLHKYICVHFYISAVALSKITLMETTYQYAKIHKASQKDGGESAIQFIWSLTVAQSLRAWLGITVTVFLLIALVDLPWRSVPYLLLSGFLLDAVMSGAITTVACVGTDSTPKSMLAALLALTNAIVSGAALPWADLHVTYRWLGLLTPMSYARYLALGNVFSGEEVDCAAGDGDSTLADLACGLLDGDTVIGVLAQKEPPFNWALAHQHEAILILIVQAVVWRLFCVLGLFLRQDSRTIRYRPVNDSIDSLLDDEGASGALRRVMEEEAKGEGAQVSASEKTLVTAATDGGEEEAVPQSLKTKIDLYK